MPNFISHGFKFNSKNFIIPDVWYFINLYLYLKFFLSLLLKWRRYPFSLHLNKNSPEGLKTTSSACGKPPFLYVGNRGSPIDLFSVSTGEANFLNYFSNLPKMSHTVISRSSAKKFLSDFKPIGCPYSK